MLTQDQEDAENLLWTGLKKADPKMVLNAINQGADVNKRYREGAGASDRFDLNDTPLHGAFKPSPWSTGARASKTSKADVSGVSEVVKLLIEHGADASALDRLDNTPLMCMAMSDKLKFDASVETLLVQKSKQAGVLDQCDSVSGYTALHYAALLGNSRLTIKICKAGANVEAPMKNGFTPLFIGAKGLTDAILTGKTTQMRKHSFTMDGLLNFKCDANTRDNDGNTIAEKNPTIPVAILLSWRYDPTAAHPVSGGNLMDLHLSRLQKDMFTSVSALEHLMEVPDLSPRFPDAGVESIHALMETKALNKHQFDVLMNLQTQIEQQLLQRDTTPSSSPGYKNRL